MSLGVPEYIYELVYFVTLYVHSVSHIFISFLYINRCWQGQTRINKIKFEQIGLQIRIQRKIVH